MKIGQMTEEQADALCRLLSKKYPQWVDKKGHAHSYDSCKRCPFGIPDSERGNYKCCQYVTWAEPDDYKLKEELGDEGYDEVFRTLKEETK